MKSYAVVVVAAAAAAAAVDAVEVAAIGNEVEVVIGEVEVVGNNAALDGDEDVEREHYYVAEVEAEAVKPVAAAGNEVAVAVALVHHMNPIHLQTQGQHCH
jgi:uncharacterized protein YacL (UPF0231 family)